MRSDMRERISASRPLMSSIWFGPRVSGGFNVYNAAALKKVGMGQDYSNQRFMASIGWRSRSRGEVDEEGNHEGCPYGWMGVATAPCE